MRLWPRLLLTLFLVLPLIPLTSGADAAIDSFRDDNNSRFEPYIEKAKERGLIGGCNPPKNDMVCPQHLVTAGEMSMTMARVADGHGGDTGQFLDRDRNLAAGSIAALTAAGIPVGCDREGVCPDRTIDRGEMAALIASTLGWGSSQPASDYTDVGTSPYRSALTRLAARGGLVACDEPVNQRLCPEAKVRRGEVMLALITAMGLGPALDIPDAPEMQRIDFGDSFDHLDLWDGRSPSSRNRVALTDAGYRDSGLRVRIPKGSHFGADFKLPLDDRLGEAPEHLFFRYYLKLDSDWRTRISGKLPGFSGVYGSTGKGGSESSPGRPGWSARLMFSPASGADGRVPIGYYVYHLGQATSYGDGLRWNEAGQINPGEWYCLEGEVELNTLGLSDGALRAWVDETPALDIDGLEFRRSEEPQIRIESFWFDVYYGGKPVAPSNLGMVIDEVAVDTNRIGCAETDRVERPAIGDFDGDGYPDRLRWDTCPIGSCFWEETRSDTGATRRSAVGSGAWFSLETHRLGLASGDIDGDGRDDLIYRGRCQGGVPCWRAHLQTSGELGTGQNWGDNARFSSRTTALVLGDWDGDGRDDLAYQGLCGDDDRDCWRAHLSNGDGFAGAFDGGPPPATAVTPIAADVDGDGRDDLVYRSPCGERECWNVQTSVDGGFSPPETLGTFLDVESRHFEMIDFDRDGRDDLASFGPDARQTTITVRFTRDGGFSEPVRVARFGDTIAGVYLRQVARRAPVQAVVHVSCGQRRTCVERLVASSGNQLVDPRRFDGQTANPWLPQFD